MKYLVAALVLPCALGAQGKADGWYAEVRTSTAISGIAAPPPMERMVREWHAGDRSRMEPFGAASSMPGVYTLVLDTSRTSYMVMPAQKKIRVAATSDLARESVADLSGAERQLGKYADLGPGETILGHPTRKYRVNASWTMKLRMLNDTTPRRVKYTRTVWLTADSSDAGIRAALRTTRRSKKTTLPRGVELRSETVTEGMQPGATLTTRREVTLLRAEPVELKRFVLPQGYQREDVAAEMRANLKRAAAMEKVSAELNRLRASQNPKDQARARVLMDSIRKAMTPDSARLREMLRKDPNAVRINGGAPKKP